MAYKIGDLALVDLVQAGLRNVKDSDVLRQKTCAPMPLWGKTTGEVLSPSLRALAESSRQRRETYEEVLALHQTLSIADKSQQAEELWLLKNQARAMDEFFNLCLNMEYFSMLGWDKFTIGIDENWVVWYGPPLS